METQTLGADAIEESISPHSLGKSVEWKPPSLPSWLDFCLFGPHSLGKSVEWKLVSVISCPLDHRLLSPLAGEIS